jgi:tripartite-type tricarboxylate transporter receptor subunit TctC
MLFGTAGVLAAPALHAQSWPDGSVRIVVPFAPGGTTDLVARLLASGLQERLGVPVIVENRAGAGATVGSRAVAQAAPDGRMLVLSNIASHAISPHLYANTGYHPVSGFTHIALVTSNPSVFVANPRFEARNLADVVRFSRTNPRGLDMATSGSGSSNHLLLVRFAELTGAQITHVPFRGAGPAMTAVIAGEVPLMSDGLPSAAGHIRQGAVRAIGVSGEARSAAIPDVPTFREQGVDLVSTSWFGLSGPARACRRRSPSGSRARRLPCWRSRRCGRASRSSAATPARSAPRPIRPSWPRSMAAGAPSCVRRARRLTKVTGKRLGVSGAPALRVETGVRFA